MDQNVSALVSAILGGVVRHGLTGLGSVLGVQGLSADNNVNLVVGTSMFVIGVAWSAVQKHLAQKSAVKVVPVAEVLAPPHV